MTKVNDIELWLVIGALATCDVVQFVLDLFGFGLVVNRFVDIAIAMVFGMYATTRKLMDQQLAIALAACFIGEEIPVVDVLPLWSFEGWYMRKRYKVRLAAFEASEREKEEAEMAQKQAAEQSRIMAAMNAYEESKQSENIRPDSLRKTP